MNIDEAAQDSQTHERRGVPFQADGEGIARQASGETVIAQLRVLDILAQAALDELRKTLSSSPSS